MSKIIMNNLCIVRTRMSENCLLVGVRVYKSKATPFYTLQININDGPHVHLRWEFYLCGPVVKYVSRSIIDQPFGFEENIYFIKNWEGKIDVKHDDIYEFIIVPSPFDHPLISFERKLKAYLNMLFLHANKIWKTEVPGWEYFVNNVFTRTIHRGPLPKHFIERISSSINWRAIPRNLSLGAPAEKGLVLVPKKISMSENVRKVLGNVVKEKSKLKELRAVYKSLVSQIDILEGINLNKGYVLSTNIFNKHYPIISELAEKLLEREAWEEMDDLNRRKVYRWLGTIVVLDIYTTCNKALSIISKEMENDKHPDYYLKTIECLKFDLLSVRFWCHSRLDNSIKQHLVRRNPSVTGEIYTGFDTEYVAIDFGENELLSAQLSICTGLKLKVPLFERFEFEGVNTSTGETYFKTPPAFKDSDELRDFVEERIKENRRLLFPGHDYNMLKIVRYFTFNRKNITDSKLTKKSYLFQFKKSSIKNRFIIGKKGENLKISFASLIHIINNSVNIENEKLLLAEILEEIKENKLRNFRVASKVASNKMESEPTKTIILSNAEDSESSNIPDVEEFKGFKCNANNKVNFNTKQYLCAHYNAADLGMLEDWADIRKGNVDIVKKSFCSLRTPISIQGCKVYIRDTILLASVAAQTLEAIGKAHGIKKLDVPLYYKQNMDEYFEKFPGKFKEYAMMDSFITLTHSLFMNDFAFSQGSTNLPCTLGSLTSIYIKNRWEKDEYSGYQINPEFPIGNAQVSVTPKGIGQLGWVGDNINMFTGSFRGGRNECFAYGQDKETIWYDYDLTACYSTIMSMCGDPHYVAPSPLPSQELVPRLVSDPVPTTSPIGVPPLDGGPVEAQPFGFRKNLNFDHREARTEGEGLSASSVKKSARSMSTDFSGEEASFSLENSEVRGMNDEVLSEAQQLGRLTPSLAALCGAPDDSRGFNLNSNSNINNIDFFKNYSAIRVSFSFPPGVKFPPIPTPVDKNITIYPLKGESTITGLELRSAINILNLALLSVPEKDKNKYFIKIINGAVIPFKYNIDEDGNKLFLPGPFFAVINELQANRRMHPKKSAKERIFKDLGNMLYGKTVCGISNKRKFDARTWTINAMTGNNLTNPIIAAWITGFVRSLLAEMLFAVDMMGGKVLSVTTDGFVTNIPDLEEKIIEFNNKNGITNSYLDKYREIRKELSGNPEALEIKTNVKGMIQWSTRAQLSLPGPGVPIAAMTGFQKFYFSHEETVGLVLDALNNNNKILFLQKSLSGALDNYKYNKKVAMISSLRKFRTVFDTKRLIISEGDSTILYTLPYENVEQAALYKELMDSFKHGIYSEQYTRRLVYTSKDSIEEAIKYFLRFALAFFSYDVNYDQRDALVLLIQEALEDIKYKISSSYLQNIMSGIILEKGNIVNKLVVVRKNSKFIYNLFNALINISFLNLAFLFDHNNENFTKFLTLFKNKFSNFPLPSQALIPLSPSIPRILDEDTLDSVASRFAAAAANSAYKAPAPFVIIDGEKYYKVPVTTPQVTTPVPHPLTPAPSPKKSPTPKIEEFNIPKLIEISTPKIPKPKTTHPLPKPYNEMSSEDWRIWKEEKMKIYPNWKPSPSPAIIEPEQKLELKLEPMIESPKLELAKVEIPEVKVEEKVENVKVKIKIKKYEKDYLAYEGPAPRGTTIPIIPTSIDEKPIVVKDLKELFAKAKAPPLPIPIVKPPKPVFKPKEVLKSKVKPIVVVEEPTEELMNDIDITDTSYLDDYIVEVEQDWEAMEKAFQSKLSKKEQLKDKETRLKDIVDDDDEIIIN